MLISTMAMMDLSIRRRSLLDRLRAVFQFTTEPGFTSESPVLLTVVSPASDAHDANPAPVQECSPDIFRWRRHPQLLGESAVPAMSDPERHARQVAVRGLYCAHNGQLEEAFNYFVQAVDEFKIDLTEIPSFWQMPRGAILAAAEACAAAGQFREASMIQARVRTELRPTIVVMMRSRDIAPRLTARGR